MTGKIRWDIEAVAVSSIAHGGQQLGTTTLFRREKILLPDGRLELIPVISGNTLRGWLRRVAEDLLRSELEYDGLISLAAAHALRGGGSLAKTSGAALGGERLAQLRRRIPLIGVFGCAAGGTIIDGCLQVGKVLPAVAELADRLPAAARGTQLPSSFDLVQVETYARQDDTDQHTFAGRHQTERDEGRNSAQMQYGVETLPAGTRLHSWAQLNWATPREISFFTEVLGVFAADGRLGGRLSTGHGQIAATLHRQVIAGNGEGEDWREGLHNDRGEALEVLTWLT